MQGKQRELEDKINKLIKISDSGKQNEETENSEAEEEMEMEDWLEKDLIKGDLKHLEDVIKTMKEQVEEDKDSVNTRMAHNEKALKSLINHSLQVLKVSSQNVNALVDHVEKKNQEKNLVIVEDAPTSSLTHQNPRCRTRQTTAEKDMKIKESQIVQENTDLREAAKAMMLLVQNAEETMKSF